MVFSLHLVGSLGVALRLCSSAFVMLLPFGANALSQTHSVECALKLLCTINCAKKLKYIYIV